MISLKNALSYHASRKIEKVELLNETTGEIEIFPINYFSNKEATYNINLETNDFYVTYQDTNYHTLNDNFMEYVYRLDLNSERCPKKYKSNTLYYNFVNTYLNTVHFFNGIGTFYQYTYTERINSRVTPTNIQVLEGVERLYTSAFQTCRNIYSCRIASSVTAISETVFISCRNLKSVIFNDNSVLKEIGNEAFFNCKVLDNILLPDTLEVMGELVFSNCHNIRYIKLSKSLATIGDMCFKNCKQLEKLYLDSSCENFTLVDDVLFTSDLKTLVYYPAQKQGESYHIPDTVETAMGSAFSSNNILTTLTMNDNVTNLGVHFAENCELLSDIQLSSSVKEIPNNSFYGCYALEYIDIPDGIETIGELAFAQCKALKKAYIPNTVTAINANAFKSCRLLTIYTNHTELPAGWITDFETFSIEIVYGVNRNEIFYPKSCLTFSSPSSFTLGVKNNTKYWDGTIEYSTDANTWNTWSGTSEISSNANGILYMRGTGNTYITGDNAVVPHGNWLINGSNVSISGNIENLLDYTIVASGEHPTMAKGCYQSMFHGCTNLIAAPELPATTLTYGCYSYMFRNCIRLTNAPNLPATTLATWCYQNMFEGCTSLTTPPKISATTLAGGCCNDMFNGCTSLTSVPELSATTLTESCYQSMFEGCTSITAPPNLPATTLANSCYKKMFYGCTSLTNATELPATTLAKSCYSGMFAGCTSLTSIPSLPATTLEYSCYENMFWGCTLIKISSTKTDEYQTAYRIPTSGTGTTELYSLYAMFLDTGGTFTGTPAINTTYYTSNTVV